MSHLVKLRRSALLLLLSCLSLAVSSQPATAPVADSLTKNAVMVVRSSQLEIDILSPRKAKLHHRYVYTILNSRGDGYANVHTFYDRYHDLVSATGILYDATGKQVKKIKKGDMLDWNTDGSGILMTDNRVKIYSFGYRGYPYTVSYEEEIEMNGLFMLPEWQPQPARNVAVEQCSLVIKAPSGYPLRYRNYDYPGETVVTEDKGVMTYTWQVSNRPALAEEQFEPAWFHQETHVRLVPGDFELQGYKGSLREWNDIGKFVRYLYQGRDQLPQEARAVVHQLTDGIADDRRKIAVLYRYLQHNTHYVGIELGIGGWQPFDATYVATKGYGDCKALSNYMYSLLKEAGIRSHYTLVKAGKGETDLIEDFTVDQFNHIILCVPMAKDTTWLECTSQDAPAGYLGDFTSNRTVLLVDETGGKLVRTPTYTMDQNLQIRRLNGTINATGDLSGKAQTRYTGMQQDWYHSFIHNVSPEKQMEILKTKLNLPSYDIHQFNYKEHADALPVPAVDEVLDITVPGYASVSGKRLFIVPNVLNKSTMKLSAEGERLSDIQLKTANKDTDTVELTIPEGYKLEAAFPETVHESKFGKYIAKVKVEGTKVTYIRTYERKAGVFPAKDFALLEEFFNKIYKADRSRIILVKAE